MTIFIFSMAHLWNHYWFTKISCKTPY